MTEPHLRTRNVELFTKKMYELGILENKVEVEKSVYPSFTLGTLKVIEDKRMPKGVVYLMDKGLIVKTFHI